jgi:unsaturated rhamnogalacturonyl hydrolase
MKLLSVLTSGILLSVAVGFVSPGHAQSGNAATRPWSQWAANAVLAQRPVQAWQAKDGLLLQGMDAAWFATATPAYYEYTKQSVDRRLVDDRKTADPPSPLPGAQLLLLYGATSDAKYYKAATTLWRRKSQAEPFTAAPFRAEYAMTFQQPEAFDAIAKQLLAVDRMTQRASGYAVALVDTLTYFPQDHPRRAELVARLNRVAATIKDLQDPESGLWRKGTAASKHQDGEFDLSTSCLFVYALEKGVRLGYLPIVYQQIGKRGYEAILGRFVRMNSTGSLKVESAGSGTKPNDHANLGAFLLASTENEMAATALLGRGDTVLLDAWFNSQKKQNAAGQTVFYHYKWDDLADSGYSFFGNVFLSYGVRTATLYAAPTLSSLSKAHIYIIASPDIPIKNPHPNYMSTADADQIARWVEQGGVLVLMENDGKNAEFEHFNQLSERFGIHFNPVTNNQVPGQDFEKGRVLVPADGEMFHQPHKIYMKEISSITASAPARSTLIWEGNTVMAVARYGRGTVYGVVDPWLYNEYTDGRRLTADFDNLAAAKEVVRWLSQQVPARPGKQ